MRECRACHSRSLSLSRKAFRMPFDLVLNREENLFNQQMLLPRGAERLRRLRRLLFGGVNKSFGPSLDPFSPRRSLFITSALFWSPSFLGREKRRRGGGFPSSGAAAPTTAATIGLAMLMKKGRLSRGTLQRGGKSLPKYFSPATTNSYRLTENVGR
jgi:hypothetical protein